MSVLDGGLTVNTHTSTELEVVGDISASSGTITGNDITAANNITATNQLEVKYRKLDITSATNHDYDGDVVFFGGDGSGFGQGRVCHYDGTDWVRAASSNAASATGLLGIALTNDPADGILIRGFYTLAGDVGNAGDALYLDTGGLTTNTPPNINGYYSRVIGHILSDTDSKIYFNPSPDWIEIET